MKVYIIYNDFEGCSVVGATLNIKKAIDFKEQRDKETEYHHWIDIINVNNEEITLFD